MIKPKFDNVVVKPLKNHKQKKHGNIIVPDLGKDKPILGEVIATGKGAYNSFKGEFVGSEFQVGDKVVLPKMGATKVEDNGEELLIISEKLILATYE